MLDVAADDGLFISDDDQRFQGRLAEAQRLWLDEFFDPFIVGIDLL